MPDEANTEDTWLSTLNLLNIREILHQINRPVQVLFSPDSEGFGVANQQSMMRNGNTY